MKKNELGYVLDSKHLVPAQHIGECEEEGNPEHLTLRITLFRNEMCVVSSKTNKKYIMDWDTVINLAIENGILENT